MKKINLLALILLLPMLAMSQPQKLFNGKNLDGWKFFLVENTVAPEKVFTAQDGIIKIAGQPFGCMYTEKAYESYQLELEWRWEKELSNSGIFLFLQEKPLEGQKWQSAIECQLKADKAGDIVHMGGAKSGFAERIKPKYCASNEKPLGEWNKAKIIVENGKATIYINDLLQNEIDGMASPVGHIALQSEGGEAQFRNVTITPLEKTKITLRHDEANKKVDVWYGDKLFTSYCFDEKIEKPTFYPVNSASGVTVTRGFPYQSRPHEHADHQHQVGLTFVFGSVNGKDFWNNSYARAAEDKYKYGSIRTRKITEMKSGNESAKLSVETEWIDNDKNLILTETVTYVFGGSGDTRTIERYGKMTAANGDVTFADNKEGLLYIRLDKVFEEPGQKPDIHTDAAGYPMTERTMVNTGTVGVLGNDRGEKMESGIFGKPTRWVSNASVKDGKKVTVVLMDNKKNVGYPARAFARGYGMMAINNLGTQCYIPTEKPFSMVLGNGKSVEFAHKFIVVDSRDVENSELEKIFSDFNK